MLPGTETHLLTWEDVLPAAKQAFSVWMHGRELEWAQVAWGYITAAGLTTYRTEVERCQVAIRLFALAQLYLDWCKRADDEEHDDDLSDWAWELDLGTFRLGQLIGNQEEVVGDDNDLRATALQLLTGKERGKVRDALLVGFGEDNGLFLSLWRINHPASVPKPPKPAKLTVETQTPTFTQSLFPDETPSLFSSDETDEEPEEEDEGEEDYDAEENWDVMNTLTDEKMAAYEWIVNGCPSIR